MSGFRMLKEVGCKLDEDLQHLSSQLFCVKVRETDEDIIAKKLQDLTTYTSKYRLLHAKISASTPQVTERVLNGADVTSDLEETIQKRILEGAISKGLSRSRAVQNLISTKDSKLSSDLIHRKERLLDRMCKLRTLDSELRQLDSVLVDKQAEHDAARAQWDALLGKLRDKRAAAVAESATVQPGPLYDKLRVLVDKMEVMRWLLGRLVTSRTSSCDWMAEPRSLRVMPLTRRHNTIASIMESDDDEDPVV